MSAKRRGVTLFELIVVVAVIVGVAAITVPALEIFMPETKVKASVDQVRTAWAEARSRAIKESRPYRFAIVPESGHYRVAPDAPEYWGEGGSGLDETLVLEDCLPGGVRFQAAGEASSGADTSDTPWVDPDTKSKAPAPAPSAYSTPVIFLPDGTAREDVSISFRVRGARMTTLQLRGMTGGTSVQTEAN